METEMHVDGRKYSMGRSNLSNHPEELNKSSKESFSINIYLRSSAVGLFFSK